ncbi:MAG: SusD/RagB family nutrient-binding outer membrane lipoprotein [Cyclobacteriaceae bacterium]
MKRIYKYFVLTMLITAFGISSCTNNFEEINRNPNQFTQASPELLLAGAMKSNLDTNGGVMNFWMFLQYGRYCGGMRGNAMQRFGVFEGFVDTYWQRMYIEALKPAREVQDLYSDDPAYTNRVQIAKALEAWTLSVIVSTWGPAPVTTAVGESLFGLTFDDELTAYTHILGILQEASDVMSTTESTDFLATDLMYGGNNENWLRFTNTLRLKIALRLTGSSNSGLSGLGQTHISDVVSNDLSMLIVNNSQNARLLWGSNSVDNYSMLYERTAINSSDNWKPSVSDEIVLWSKAYNDPRLTAFASPSSVQLAVVDNLDDGGTPVDVTYGIPYLGSPIGGNASYGPWQQNPTENPLVNATPDHYSDFHPEYTKQDSEFMIISSAETMFMLAEIAQTGLATLPSTAATYYYSGIDESFDRFSPFITGSYDLNAYKAQPGVAYNTASTETLYNWTSTANTGISDNQGLKQIVIQRWIAMFFQGHDAWCLQKRTNLLPWAPYLNPADRSTPIDHPERMKYSNTDKGRSAKEYEDAIEKFLGGVDWITTPIEMNKVRTVTDWVNFAPAWSSDFGTKWYGTSIADLEAAGMTDVTGLSSDEQITALGNGTGYIRL